MSKKTVLPRNYMDYVPMKNPEYKWETNEKGRVVIDEPNVGFFNRIAQKFFHRPKVSHIQLDAYGSFVWQQIDGKNTIYDISELVKAEFGKKAEPVLNRLVEFFRILKFHRFIIYKND
ncbi:PqqD family protein [Diplocloster agilis]|uniref:PqqD family protein n=1 Tax=Diplocloster agilis TaxID=2850323 RepID=UPI000821E8F7|nr:PqqD family protein [Suonthocola fibrivorans]MCU6736482.1 PqqD family protein [Suonthocola fibrivorans]SCJ90963.1 Coenzyme PQQ synthesis protein D (PqqD) [uncultured Clostridium sp.]